MPTSCRTHYFVHLELTVLIISTEERNIKGQFCKDARIGNDKCVCRQHQFGFETTKKCSDLSKRPVNSYLMAAVDRVRILVVGDAGVGKTSLVHLLCHNEPIGNPYWTIGCSVEVKLHDYKAGTPVEKPYFVELWDVGGWSAHQNSRSIFYNPVHGIILVHDLTNRKSQQNLRKWLAEVLNKDSKEGNDDYDPEQFAGTHTPILVIGTKLDQAQVVRENALKRSSSIAEECGADEINLDCTQVKHLAPGTGNAVKISRFFDKVIERRYHSRESNQGFGFPDRKRYHQYQKTLHAD